MTRGRKPRPLPEGVDPKPSAKFRRSERDALRFLGLMEGVAEEVSSAARFLERLPECRGLQPEGRRYAAAIRGVLKRVRRKVEGTDE